MLQVAGTELAEAIAKSRVLSRHLAARLGPTAFLVKTGRADALREQLAALGFTAEVQVLPAGGVRLPPSAEKAGIRRPDIALPESTLRQDQQGFREEAEL